MPRAEQIAEAMRSFRRVAIETDAAVIVASQINRDPTKTDEGPKHDNLKGSGSLEESANMIGLLDRPEWLKALPVTLLHLTKNKDGKTGTVVLNWNAPTVTFSDAPDELLDRVYALEGMQQ